VPDQDPNEDVTRRQLGELLAELRVALPGVTVLFAFLLTLPFTSRFSDLSSGQDAAYYTGLLSAAISAVLFIAPSAMHRIEHDDGGERRTLVQTSTWCAIAGSVFLITSMLASLYLVVDIVYEDAMAGISVAIVGVLALVLWYALPLAKTLSRRNRDSNSTQRHR
jgi:hypothetical protein